MNKSWTVKNVGVLLLCAALMAGCSTKAADTASSGEAVASAATAVTAKSGESANASPTSEQPASIDLADKAEFDEQDRNTAWSADAATTIQLNGEGASVQGTGATAEERAVTISSAGTYVVSGKLNDGQLVIDVPDDGIVQVILNGAEIYNASSAAIYAKAAGKTIITLAEGTDNRVSDGETYVYPDATTDEPSAAIFSKDDLTINGSGSLTVQANSNDGITSKDDLKIVGGTLEIDAADDGLVGRDLMAVQEGTITIKSAGDGIKTTNDTDTDKGNIVLFGGTFEIESANDGFQAENAVLIGGGAYTIKTGGGSEASAQLEATDAPSMKAIKAEAGIWIEDGTFRIDSTDDSLHSAGAIRIAGGTITAATGDDGIHSDSSISITGGSVEITKSYEGIEAPSITLAGGEIRVTASDDGINISDGDEVAADRLTISGGYLTVDAQGDGLDSNGSIVMSGGTVLVNGPTNNGNGALDYDGTFEMTGGFLVATGSSGMAQATSDQSTQYGIMMTYPQTQAAGTLVHLEDGEGNALLTFSPSKAYQSVFISSPELKKDVVYTLYSGGASTGSEANGLYSDGEYKDGTKVVSFELAENITWLNESGVTEARVGMGGPGGGRGPGGRGEGGGFGQDGDRMRPEGGQPPQQ
ncbi:carbohydrate-binding domain-containing protein [Cohnella boryungensis]|uniref:Carbohydrate-binding domain-containing protein n=1 Tax=Cohnella boryungensis TaxID=768479 RepID=A0ABV8S8U2_9BACL